MAQTKVTAPGIADDAVTVAKIPNTSITNAKLANSSITIDGAPIALGGSVTTGSYPTFTSTTPSTVTNELTSLVIVGTNFGSSGIPAVEFQSSTGVITAASTVTRDSATQLTVGATIPTDGTYYIRIELNTGLAVRSTTAVLTVSDAPVWTTGAGSLGIIAGDFSGTVATVAATGDGVEYTETTDVLENATLANCSLNSSTGVITTTDFGADDTVPTTFTFTIRATDDQGQTSDREFTLTSSYTYACAFLVVAGGASGGGGGYGGAGGAGGYRNSYLSEASGGGGSSEADLGLSEGTVYTIDVGDGGASVGSSTLGIDGADSSISGSDITNIVTDGGGRGGNDAGGSIATLDNTTNNILQSNVVAGKKYKFSFTFATDDTDVNPLLIGADEGNTYAGTGAGDKVIYFTGKSSGSPTFRVISLSSGKYYTISNLSLKQVNGNP